MKPDYEAMWKELKQDVATTPGYGSNVPLTIARMHRIEKDHTPQQPTRPRSSDVASVIENAVKHLDGFHVTNRYESWVYFTYADTKFSVTVQREDID